MPDGWHDLYVMLGSSSAALLGLMFVATSLHLEDVVRNPVFGRRARNMTLHLLALLVEAAAILTPQPTTMVGAEVIVINLLGLWLPLEFAYRAMLAGKKMARHGGWAIHRNLAYTAGYLLGVAGGAVLIGLGQWGLYLVTASYILLLVFVVMNAWAILLGLGLAERVKK